MTWFRRLLAPIEKRSFTVLAQEGAQLSDSERDDVSTAVYTLGKLNPVSGRFSVTDELESTGRLANGAVDAGRSS
ncbi:MAG TPA: hypothetical protein VLA33_00185 [Gemmatimonadota bacterium]|nr:hypothetical protein [Gemmatimonadota bacterium]